MEIVLDYCPETGAVRNKRGTVMVQWHGLEDCALVDDPVADMVNHPPHYTQHPSGVECIELSEHLPANLSHAFNYLFREGIKGGSAKAVEDRRKALFYLRRELSLRESRHEPPMDRFNAASDNELLTLILAVGLHGMDEALVIAIQMLEELVEEIAA